MRPKKMNVWLLVGLLGLPVWGVLWGIQMYGAFGANTGIYWTPRSLALRIEDTRDAFEFFIAGTSIHDHLADGAVLVRRNGHLAQVAPDDIAVRLNNWHNVRSSRLTHALWSGMIVSACITLVVIGLFQMLGGSALPGPPEAGAETS